MSRAVDSAVFILGMAVAGVELRLAWETAADVGLPGYVACSLISLFVCVLFHALVSRWRQ